MVSFQSTQNSLQERGVRCTSLFLGNRLTLYGTVSLTNSIIQQVIEDSE